MRTNVLETVKVNSTAINEVKYDVENEALQVEFVNKSKYIYKEVPKHVFNGIADSDSKGKFINQYIIGKFKYEAVPSAPLIQHGNSAIHVTRLEIINHCKNEYGFGRILSLHKGLEDFNEIELDYQDGGKTLKIFLS
jgi:hypothetical protein